MLLVGVGWGLSFIWGTLSPYAEKRDCWASSETQIHVTARGLGFTWHRGSEIASPGEKTPLAKAGL